MKSSIILSILLAVVSVKCDTPANCTYEDARGLWTFLISSDPNLKDCRSGTIDNGTKLEVNLMYPDIAKDQYGNMGFWTLIYNQGFEVVIGGRKYFSFFKYKKDGTKVTSYCDQLSNGWTHDVLERHWFCFSSRKNAAIPPRFHMEMELLGGEEKMVPNPNFVNAINMKQKSWGAVLYPELFQLTRRQVFLRNGGPNSKVLNRPRPTPVSEELKRRAAGLPTNFDWRNVSGRNFVSPVRNQGSCGSCYSFSSMGMLESRLQILRKNSLKVQLSEQDIVDCSPYAQGCDGGFPYLIAGKHAEDFGVVTEACNPYTGAGSSKCTTNMKKPECQKRYYATSYRYVGGYYGACNEALMRISLLLNGPMSVSFEVYNDFFHYSGGIYSHTGLKDGFNPFQVTNHAVLLVGYGEDPKTGELFWVVKNSWGESWGEAGYFRIRRNTDECGIESMALESFPIL